jgi:hypothetical protein
VLVFVTTAFVVRVVNKLLKRVENLLVVSVLVVVEGLTVSVVNVTRGTRVVQTDVEVPTTSEVYVDKTSEVVV